MIDVQRSPDPPASLTTTSRWDGLDVRQALARDFHYKCYLCERHLKSGEAEVDHRIPRSVWQEGTLEWRNLYPACRYCNLRRNGRKPPYPSEGLISPGEDVEGRLSQRVLTSEDGVSVECEFRARRLGDHTAMRTAEELGHVHSSDTATTGRASMAAQELLDEIHDHYYYRLYPLEMRVLRGRQRDEPEADAEAELSRLLSRRAPFTMLMRSLVHSALSDLFD
jgi:HNH endonuclease